MTQQQIDALCEAVSNDIINSFQKSKKRRYAQRLIYNFRTAFESVTGAIYKGEINLADLSAAMRSISAAGEHSTFETVGAPLAYMRSLDRAEAINATFAGYAHWITAYACDRQLITGA